MFVDLKDYKILYLFVCDSSQKALANMITGNSNNDVIYFEEFYNN